MVTLKLIQLHLLSAAGQLAGRRRESRAGIKKVDDTTREAGGSRRVGESPLRLLVPPQTKALLLINLSTT